MLAIRPYLAYLRRLWLRMEKRSFPKDDGLFRAMSNAYDATHSLWITLHYMSCASGVCRGPRRVTTSGPFSTWAS